MDDLIQAMTIPELENFKTTYKDNESVTKIIDGYIEVKGRELAQAKAKVDFEKAVGKLVGRLPHPDDIHNIYLRWAKHDEEVSDEEAEEVEVEVVKTPAVLDKEGAITTPAEMEKAMRKPGKTIEVWSWEVETNKGFTVGKAASATTTSKRAVTVNKRNGQVLEFVGNFPTASKACEHLGLACAGSLNGTDSGTRVLNREGYILDAYTGTDFSG